MNTYLRQNIKSVEVYLDTFMQSCMIATLRDDGKRDREEAKTIAAIQKATDKYKTSLKKIIKEK